MITLCKVILVAKAKEDLEWFCRFEAIEAIEAITDPTKVWARNMTPVYYGNDIKIGETSNLVFAESDFGKDAKEFTKFCHSHGFECGEEITGIKYDSSKERCILCELASYKGLMNSLSFYNEHVEREVDCILYESSHFYVTSELGALKQGYLMVVPKEHILSVAQFPNGYMTEYNQVCKDVETLLLGAYPTDSLGNPSSVTFMEHGSGPSGITSHKKSIVHAHTHAVVNFRLKPLYQEMVQLKEIDNIQVAKDIHYFSYQESIDGPLKICMDPAIYVQRQFPRQVMADELDMAPGQYNWRKVGFEENIRATLYNIHEFLTKNLNSLPLRIQNRTRGFIEGYPRREDNDMLED